MAGLRSSAVKIQLFYDVLSPYSWIGFELLQRYSQRWNIQLELCPFYLAGVMKGSDNRPPGMVPQKANSNGKDLSRLAQFCQIPLRLPSNPAEVMFSKGSLNAQRLLTAVKMSCPNYLVPLSRQLWLRIWSRDEDITADDSLRVAAEKADIPQEKIDALIGQISETQIKEELKRATQEALDSGAFGAPWIIAHVGGKKERFFGSDRMELLAHTIGEKYEGPLVELSASL